MPFITEELWQDLAERKEGETIMYAPTPKAEPYDAAVLDNFALAMETVNGVRGIRNQRNIGPKEALSLKIKAGSFPCIPLIEKMAGVKVELVQDLGDGQGAAFLVRTTEMGIPLTGMVNVEEEIEKAQKDLEYQQKFLAGIRGKLSNERFVNNAPAAVIENERKKEADTLSRIETLEAKLKQLKESK